jgi:hypothetical protein
VVLAKARVKATMGDRVSLDEDVRGYFDHFLPSGKSRSAMAAGIKAANRPKTAATRPPSHHSRRLLTETIQAFGDANARGPNNNVGGPKSTATAKRVGGPDETNGGGGVGGGVGGTDTEVLAINNVLDGMLGAIRADILESISSNFLAFQISDPADVTATLNAPRWLDTDPVRSDRGGHNPSDDAAVLPQQLTAYDYRLLKQAVKKAKYVEKHYRDHYKMMTRSYNEKLTLSSKQLRAAQRALKTVQLERDSYISIVGSSQRSHRTDMFFQMDKKADVVEAVDKILGRVDDADDIESLRKAASLARVLAAQLQQVILLSNELCF